MPSTRTISDIKAKLLRPATTSHFEVEIPTSWIPRQGAGSLEKWAQGDDQDRIRLMCSEVSLPGSNLATFDINNDRTGVTEKHVHRRVFDDRIDLTFYVDAGLYQPIKFFEQWMTYITNGRNISLQDQDTQLMQSNYDYRIKYPDSYMADQGLKITKFEKDHQNLMQYEFIRVFPLAVNSMPVSYDTSSLLKCTVSLSYVRYIVKNLYKTTTYSQQDPFTQSQFNSGGLSGFAGGLVDSAVDRLTGNDLLGDIAGGLVQEALR